MGEITGLLQLRGATRGSPERVVGQFDAVAAIPLGAGSPNGGVKPPLHQIDPLPLSAVILLWHPK